MATSQTEFPDVIELEKKSAFPYGGFFLGMLAGAVIGGVVALLFAPKSGSETREILMGKMSDTRQMLADQVTNVKERASRVREAMRTPPVP